MLGEGITNLPSSIETLVVDLNSETSKHGILPIVPYLWLAGEYLCVILNHVLLPFSFPFLHFVLARNEMIARILACRCYRCLVHDWPCCRPKWPAYN